MPAVHAETDERSQKFGTFGGVFTPCTLTILGVIMFLRFGQVVGQAGVYSAVVIVLASKLITTLTSLSLSAIVTNTRVRGGGTYYLISRSLGVEFGGAIGIVFFLAQAISVAMYVLGFTEALTSTFPSIASSTIVIASSVNLVIFMCVYVGAGWTIKVQYGILIILVAALLSFYVGAVHVFSLSILHENLLPHFTDGENFFSIFALFFPAVTGIMAGANMSGDLENPARSIPRGTLAAVGVTALIYLSMALLLGGVRPSDELITNNFIVRDVSSWPVWITAGVFAATLSSALGSMMGAPRIMQAFTRDEVFPWLNFFGAASGVSNEPRRATVLTFVISQGCILLGDLNAIAPIITMFFMITYALLNLATFYEAVTKNPSYRPTFRYCHWSLSLLGAVGCLAVMLLINWVWALASVVVIAAIYGWIQYREIEARWGDCAAELSLNALSRPAATRRDGLPSQKLAAHSACLVEQCLESTSIGHLWSMARIRARYPDARTSRVRRCRRSCRTSRQLRTSIAEVHRQRGIRGVSRRGHQRIPLWRHRIARSMSRFGRSETKYSALRLAQDRGEVRSFRGDLATSDQVASECHLRRFPLEREEAEGEDKISNRDATFADAWEVPAGTIDVWWRGMKNGTLMLLLAHLLRQNPEWRHNSIRVLRIVPAKEAVKEVRKHIEELATASRIRVEPVVIVSNDPFISIQTTSTDAAILLLGFEAPGEGEEAAFFRRMENLAGSLPPVLFVNSTGGMELES